jgi:putative membrane protein
MLNFFIKWGLSTLCVLGTTYILPGVRVNGIITALAVAVVISLLNTFIRPILIFLTLPATILTLGLFLLVINSVIVLIAERLVPGFDIDGFFVALVFSVVLSIFNSIVGSILD